MKFSKITLLFFISIVIGAQSFILQDDIGNSISINEIPARVISLAPNITEMIYQLNAEDKLVGNTAFCYYPEDAKYKNKVGDLLTINYEKILELKPDLILLTVEGNQKTAYDKLLNLGLKLFVSNPRDYNGIKKTFEDLGNIFGEQSLAKSKIDYWDSTLSYIRTEAKKLNSHTVMILVELNPIMVAGRNTFINTYIETCNMKNFAEDISLNYPIFSREVVIERDPFFIVYPSSGKETTKTLTNMYPEWEALSAVKESRVLFVDRDLYFRPGPRFIEALEDFYSRLLAVMKVRHR